MVYQIIWKKICLFVYLFTVPNKGLINLEMLNLLFDD